MNGTRYAFFLMILSTLLISLTLVSMTASEQSEVPKEIQNGEQQVKEALAVIREAEAAGEENQIATLVKRLNLAINLIEQAKRGYTQGNSTSTDETAAQAAYLCNQLKDEASQIRDAALTRSHYNKILLFSMVPVAAMIVTICVHYGLKWWRRSEVEGVMKMEIKEK